VTLFDAGVFALYANHGVLQLLPPLTLSDREADDIIVDGALR